MSGERYPCITYERTRECEGRANLFALEQARGFAEELEQLGFDVLDRFGDPEFADRFCGWLEPREGWKLALAAAAGIARKEGRCTVAIQRVDGIGTGDLFLPSTSCVDDLSGVSIAVANFGLRGHASLTSLRSANARFARFRSLQRQRSAGSTIVLPRLSGDPEIVLEPDYRMHCTHAFFANWSNEPLTLHRQVTERPLLRRGDWSEASVWRELLVPAERGIWLETFFQGEQDPVVTRWRFRVGQGRNTRVGNVIVTPMDLGRTSLALRWYSYDPEMPASTKRESDRPPVETPRLRLLALPGGREDPVAGSLLDASGAGNTGVSPALHARPPANRQEGSEEARDECWRIERKRDRTHLGTCSALVVSAHEAAGDGEWRLCWDLREDCEGEGYDYEAVAAIMQLMFDERKVRAVTCRIDEGDYAAIRVADRLGMQQVSSARGEKGRAGIACAVYRMTDTRYWQTGMTAAALD